MEKKVVLSGMRPTGAFHLGNYFGAFENWLNLIEKYDCYFFVADWHALTSSYENTSAISENTRNMLIDWLSCGLDPNRCTIFVQSSIKEHAELHLLFSMFTPLSWLYRCPTYKDQLAQLKDKNITTYGFLGYPCLQAADILIYKADFVPVGEDQLPHIELTREIARRFNYLYGNVFPEPQPLLTKSKVLPGTDGRKMSKSYNNTISLSDDEEIVKQKTMSMITDPARIRKDDPGHPDICSVFKFHQIFNEAECLNIENDCKNGKIGCVACKKRLTQKINEFLCPIREKRNELTNNPKLVEEVIENGKENAGKIASKTMDEVRKAIKLI